MVNHLGAFTVKELPVDTQRPMLGNGVRMKIGPTITVAVTMANNFRPVVRPAVTGHITGTPRPVADQIDQRDDKET
jgi:hypothetical protein